MSTKNPLAIYCHAILHNQGLQTILSLLLVQTLILDSFIINNIIFVSAEDLILMDTASAYCELDLVTTDMNYTLCSLLIDYNT
jgi:hypothetical protein